MLTPPLQKLPSVVPSVVVVKPEVTDQPNPVMEGKAERMRFPGCYGWRNNRAATTTLGAITITTTATNATMATTSMAIAAQKAGGFSKEIMP